MESDIQLTDMHTVLNIAKVEGFTGEYTALGGGEVNNTYKLNFPDKHLILRVAKDEGQSTLQYEARALELLNSPFIPKLIYFSEKHLIHNRLWILESYLPGEIQARLSPDQFYNLGQLLAMVHQVTSNESGVNLKEQFVYACRAFVDEDCLYNHPDPILQQLIRKAFGEFEELQPVYATVTPTLIHQDATPSNILVDGNDVALIDWEFSKFNDPMCDFSTIYYEDMEYNRGKWRIQIREDEKLALFDGYRSAGGELDESRIKFWIRFDKLGAAIFLYWRLNQSTRTTHANEIAQYKHDYDNLISSLLNT